MDLLFYIVVVLLIILKLLIWSCVFYSRAKRARTAQGQRGQMGVIIIQDGRRGILYPADSDLGINNIAIENPQQPTMLPPTYDEVLEAKSAEVKPPSYDQVLQSTSPSNNVYQSQVSHTDTTPYGTIAQPPTDVPAGSPPSYSPSEPQQQQQNNQQH